MILLVGGAAETGAMAGKLAGLGRRTMALTLSDTPLDSGAALGVERRVGKLDMEGMMALIKETGAVALVDAAHPYAALVHANAREAARRGGIPCLAYLRPGAGYSYEKLHHVASHGAAAGLAFSFGSPVLLATGSRNLTPYVLAARKAGLRVIARVLDNQESAQACRAAGLADDEVISGRGPFSVEENLKSVRAYGIGVLVTKDGGAAGGGPEKIEAARAADIPVVMIDRPAREMDGTYHDMDELITELKRLLNKHGGNPNSESGAAL